MPTLAPPPLKRLTRPKEPLPFRVTERDIAILRALARFRFLSSAQIARFVGGSEQNILRRLKLLFDHGHADRPRDQRVQLAAFFDEGNPPLTYGLGRTGARLLAELGDPISAKLDWTTKNARATARFIAHTIETAGAILHFVAACEARAGVRLIDHHALVSLMPETTRAMRDPFAFRVPVKLSDHPDLRSITIVPDRLFSLAYPDNTRTNYALELDRGTMDVTAKTLRGKSSFRKKQIAYFHGWKDSAHTRLWGFKSFRVLTVTPSEKRIENMLKSQRDVTKGAAAGLFLYTTPGLLADHGAFGDAWVNGKGERVSVLSP